MKTASRLGSFVLVLALLCGAKIAYAAVSLRPSTEVDRAAIRLSDVFYNLPEGIDCDIAIAPAPGRSVTYDVNVLTRLAQQYRLEWQAQGVADRALLTRASTRITQEMLRDGLANKIKEQAHNLRDARIDILFDNRTLEVNLPKDQLAQFTVNNLEYDAETQRFRGDVWAGAAPKAQVITVTGRVQIKRDVPILVHRLESGAIISDDDLGWTTITAEHLPADMLTAPADLIGHSVRRDIGENTPLRARDIMQPRLVARGTLVTMRIDTPHIQMTAQGRAMQDGSVGETVKVTNTRSNRVVEGVVEGQGVVKIAVIENSLPAHASAAK